LLEQRVAVLPGVAEVRQLGMMVGIELLAPIAPDHDPVRQAVLAARRRGAAIGSCGDVIVLTPALAITDRDLRRLVAITASSIAEAYVGRLPGARVTLRRA
jgi:adenosylmethionine-8-amino-7-oxononanoate aminotransferase